MRRICLLDIDGVVYYPGNGNDDDDRLMPGVVERLRAKGEDTIFVAFTARPLGKWFENLVKAGIPLAGYLHKPLADEYYIIDDKLRPDLCSTRV